jgi:2-haloacid dehalogenase
MTALQGIRALVFDVFGTLVDWRGSIAREVQALLAPRGVTTDWLAFADAWRAQYQPAMEEVRTGQIPFSKLDVLHRRNLEVVLKDLGIRDLDEATKVQLNLAWHRLDAWPDVAPGLQRLRERYRIAPCSNGLRWHASRGAYSARDYKPKAIVYQSAAAAFDCTPHEVLMVAAHSSDLAAAAQAGLRTAFVARPDEKGPGRGESRATVPVDISVGSLIELADRLDA